MTHRQKPINIYYSPNENAYHPPAIKKEMIRGKKPRGWNLTNSTFCIYVDMVYHIKYNSSTERKITKKHKTTIRNVRFSSSNKLEVALTSRLAEKIPEWEKSDIEKISKNLPPNRYVVNAGKKNKIYIKRE